jgi:hypothetical protein
LHTQPAGVTFHWYTTDTTELLSGSPSPTYPFGPITNDTALLVKPDFAGVSAVSGDFPPGALTVRNAGANPNPMRWTGLDDTEWDNPTNWVERVNDNMGTHDAPASRPPTRYTDVTLSADASHFPDLKDSAWCRNILIQDRALLAKSARADLRQRTGGVAVPRHGARPVRHVFGSAEAHVFRRLPL